MAGLGAAFRRKVVDRLRWCAVAGCCLPTTLHRLGWLALAGLGT